jgi:tRNA A-37 threonylcarbamoyl transferase component Bud32
VVDGVVYVGSWDDRVYALDAADGTELWRFQTEGGVRGSLAVVDGTVYVGSRDRNVYALTSGPAQTATATATATESSATAGTTTVGSTTVETVDEGSTPTATDSPTASATPTETIVAGGDEPGTSTADGDASGLGQWLGLGGGALATVLLAGGITRLYGGSSTSPSDGGDSDDSVSTRPEDDRPEDLDRADVGPGDDSAPGEGPADTPEDGPGSGSLDPPADSHDEGTAEQGDPSLDDSDEGTTQREIEPVESGGASGGDASRSGVGGSRPESQGEASTDDQSGFDEAPGPARPGPSDEESDDSATEGAMSDEPVAGADDSEQPDRHAELRGRLTGLRTAVDDATERIEDAPSVAREQFEALASDCEALALEAREEGIDGLPRAGAALEATCRERVSVADEWVAWHPGPPDEIPSAPGVDVEYEGLVDEQPLGVGGNADVTRATLATPEGDVTLAIKKPRMSGTLHTEQVERMLKEAETWDKLDDHDHVVDSVDYGSEPLPWIAMEYMDGGHLGERAGVLETGEALWTALAIANAVHHAHRRGIAHLDLKPENVLFRTVEGAWDVPKVADWGLSKHLLDHSKSVQGMTVEYAAPEQFGGEFGSTDDITDVYQLGAVLYELFVGRPPFEGKPFDVINQVKNDRPAQPSEVADVPEELDDVLLTALAREKADRYESVVYLRDDLREIYDDNRPPEP